MPLVESGTAGYIGQTYVIKKGVTPCFDCEPVSDTKTYPICTIRRCVVAATHTNASTPVHTCVRDRFPVASCGRGGACERV